MKTMERAFRIAALLVAVLADASIGLSGQTKGDISPDNLYAKNRSSVVTVLTFDANKAPLSQGSGFVVARDRIITNYHVIKGSAAASIIFDDGTVLPCDTLTAGSEPKDLVILAVKTGNRLPLQLGNELDVKVGQSVFAIGTPQGLSESLSSGLVSAFREDEGQFLIQITASISPGSSGGPLFNTRGQVIGITTSKLKDGSFGFAVGAGDIQHLLKVPLPVPVKLSDLLDDNVPSSTNLAAVQELYDQKKYEDAAKSFQELPTDLKQSYDGELLLCKIQVDMPEHPNDDACNDAISLRPAEGAPYSVEAYGAFKARNLDLAEKEATKAVQLSNDSDAKELLGLIYYLQERYPLVSNQISEDTKDTFALTLLEGAALRTGEKDKYLRLDAKMKSIRGSSSAWQIYWDGIAAQKDLRWDEALDDYHKCDKDPDFMDPICAVAAASVELTQGSRAQAKADIDTALYQYFRTSSVITEAIFIRLVLDDKQGAKDLYRELQAKSTGPSDFTDCLYYYGIDQPVVANSYCVANKNANDNSNVSWSNAGYVALDMGQYQAALEDFSKAERLYEADKVKHTETEELDLMWGLLVAGYMTGDKEDARVLYSEIKKTYPDFVTVTELKQLPLVWSKQTLVLVQRVIEDFN